MMHKSYTRQLKRLRRIVAQQQTGIPAAAKAVHLHNDVLHDSASFLRHTDVDSLLLTNKSLCAFVKNNAEHLSRRELKDVVFDFQRDTEEASVILTAVLPDDVPSGVDRRVTFEGAIAELLSMQEQFRACVADSEIGCMKLGCGKLPWTFVREILGAASASVIITGEFRVNGAKGNDIEDLKAILKSFSMINALAIGKDDHMWGGGYDLAFSTKCDDSFLRWCAASSICQLSLELSGGEFSGQGVLEFCFGDHGTGSDPCHIKAGCCPRPNFVQQLLEANRKYQGNGQVTMDLCMHDWRNPADMAALQPYKTEKKDVYVIPEEHGLRVRVSQRGGPGDRRYRCSSTCCAGGGRFQVLRPAKP